MPLSVRQAMRRPHPVRWVCGVGHLRACRTECLPLPPSWGGPSGAVHPAPATRVPEHACSALTRVWRTRVWRSAPSGCASVVIQLPLKQDS